MKKSNLSPLSIDFIKEIFQQIETAYSVKEVDAIAGDFPLPVIYPKKKYKPFSFSITAKEWTECEKAAFSGDIENHLPNSISKLLYALIWKQGDLPKIKHIIDGIRSGQEVEQKGNALVFKQFGRHLANREEEPIIDQHVLRAYSLFKVKNDEEILALRKQTIFKDWTLVNKYKNWLSGLRPSLRQEPGWLTAVDRLLFVVGKSAKLQ